MALASPSPLKCPAHINHVQNHWVIARYVVRSKKISSDQEPIKSDPTTSPHNVLHNFGTVGDSSWPMWPKVKLSNRL